jgi:hypothetical protein
MCDEVSAQNIESIVRKLVSFKTRHTLSDTTSKTEGIGAARNWIKGELQKYAAESGGRMKVEFDEFVQPAGQRMDKPATLKNILAILKGTDANDTRVYIVSGHYDSRASNVMDVKSAAPGAVDDASGTAVSMEMARVMAKRSFPATIIFVAMVGEEQGLYGATHLSKRAREEKWGIGAVLNNDIVGNTYGMETDLKDNRSVRIFSEGMPAADTGKKASMRISIGGENDSPSRELARYIKEVGERYVDQLDVKLIYRRDRYLRGGDHTPFAQQGFTSVRITEMNENFNRQHQDVRKENGVDYGDLPDYADYNYIQKVARMNLSTLANLALAPAEPLNVGLVTSGLTNKTTIRWEAPKNKASGYFVLMRETSSPVWERKFYVEGLTITLPYSKDNYLFAVQSVDENKHESLPVFPVPVK